MTEEVDVGRLISSLRRQRGTVKGSITRLAKTVKELEGKTEEHKTLILARRMAERLKTLDQEFREHHAALIDVIDDDGALLREQEELDGHDDGVSLLTVDIELIIAACGTAPDPNARKIASRRIGQMKKTLDQVKKAIDDLSEGCDDICLLRHQQEQLADIKKGLQEANNSLLVLDLEEGDELELSHAELEKLLLECSLGLKRLVHSHSVDTHSTSSAKDSSGVRLPKLDVPTFDGALLNWRSFWEQFCISVHDRTSLSNSEKLVYLQQSLKGGSAKSIIEGLSRTGDHYDEAIQSLKTRYDRPRLIHRAHVRVILEAPCLRDGSGKELRRLHDLTQQHLRALKSMGYEPPGPFVTSALELKLDETTLFEWQKHTQSSDGLPCYQELLDFINLRSQASETSVSDKRQSKNEVQPHKKPSNQGKFVTSFASSVPDSGFGPCILCKTEKHPLYFCTKFKNLAHDQMVSMLKENNICLNCLRPGHFVRQCRSHYKCKTCQRPHHTLLHVETPVNNAPMSSTTGTQSNPVPTHATVGFVPSSLLMTCRVLVDAPDGSTVEARALLDSASSASFVSERLAQSLFLPRSSQSARISGVAGLIHKSPVQSVTSFTVSATRPHGRKFGVSAIIVPRVTCDLPVHTVTFSSCWSHLQGLDMADPTFGCPGKIDLLLGVNTFVEVLLTGRRVGPTGSPIALETEFGWVLAGGTNTLAPIAHVATLHSSLLSGDDLLRQFWEIEENPGGDTSHTLEEELVVRHFKDNHVRSDCGRFAVPLPRKPNPRPLGESRSQAVRRFLTLERSLESKGQINEFNAVIQEYFDRKHAELVPVADLEKSPRHVFYMPMQVIRKESSTTTKVRAVFDASAKSSSLVSLNDLLMVGPTVHPSLIDVLLRFRMHRVALVADVSRMYRAVELVETDKDLHRFIWRKDSGEPLQDYRMTRLTFGVSASSFLANMAVKQNAIDFSQKYPLAASVVHQSFYVDDGLSGANSVDGAIELQTQLQNLFAEGDFVLRKWNSSDPAALEHIPTELKDPKSLHSIPGPEEYSKTLGIEWNAWMDHFRLTISQPLQSQGLTKRALISDVAKTYDVLGWFSPVIIKVKILFQQLWELKVDWDDLVPSSIKEAWLQWRGELKLLSDHHISRCYFPKDVQIVSMQLHGFSDASERAYAGVVYLRMVDTAGRVHVSLVMSKTKVAPIKQLTIPRLELCGAQLLARLLHHIQGVFQFSTSDLYAWTDSTIVLGWLSGNPRRFKTYVSNRVSSTIEQVAPDRWNHVNGVENPADCASRGLFPSELKHHELWWDGPTWLKADPTTWPKQSSSHTAELSEEEKEICFHTAVIPRTPLFPLNLFSSFTKMKRVTAWVLRFKFNCKAHKGNRDKRLNPSLTVEELVAAENYWVKFSQSDHFLLEIEAIKRNDDLPASSHLVPLHPFLDSSGVLRVGGREHNSNRSFASQHPAILKGTHPLTRLMIHTEHLRLLHAGPTLLASSINRRFHIVGGRKIVRTITRSCITCRRDTAKPRPQMLGQLPVERVTPGHVFDRVGVDFAGPINIKIGAVRKPTIVKAYICVFVSLAVKAVHLEAVSDLTTDAFLASLRRFIARRGKPSLIMSDHGTNFVGAGRELEELALFLDEQKTQGVISDFCSSQHIVWNFIPERAPHFGGIWEAAVKSLKTHLRRVTTGIKLNFEELTTVLAQIEACLNSRPLVPLPCDDDGVEALTPGHFLIGRPIESFPNDALSYRSISLLRRWHLCQSLVRQFWVRWSAEYLAALRRYTKWNHPSRNIREGDIVVLHEDGLVPTKWPLARITKVFHGKDGLVRVVLVKTQSGTYRRPVTKVALLLPSDP